ncbi:MAG: putative carbon monoxide dehydrogenase accessory protein [Ilumatobacteraceae bacterium]|nr:putative carbon monoxide dehydrogenase accessory protein [Ilumatobacteraceae bacterium]
MTSPWPSPHDADRSSDPTIEDAETIATAFARVLRGLAIAVPIGNVLAFTEALGAVGIDQRSRVYWAARATLVRRPEDVPLFDRAFAVFWESRTGDEPTLEEELQRITIAMDTDDSDDDDGSDPDAADADDDPTIQLRFSATEVLRQKDFGAYSDDELRLAQQLMAQLRFVGQPRHSLRLVPATRHHRRPDLRRTVHASLRAGGEPVERHWREPGQRMRRMVLLLDVSGSMEPYARALLRFVQAAVAGRQKVEAFAMGTRLTRITKELGSRDPDQALRLASSRVSDWSGGTRLGETLRRFNDEWGVRGMARGAIVIVLSDGWDRGDPQLLADQMQRLQRITHELVWVNPLKVTPGYAPLARGMAAALPYVDHFVEGHSMAAMEELARVVSGAATRTTNRKGNGHA